MHKNNRNRIKTARFHDNSDSVEGSVYSYPQTTKHEYRSKSGAKKTHGKSRQSSSRDLQGTIKRYSRLDAQTKFMIRCLLYCDPFQDMPKCFMNEKVWKLLVSSKFVRFDPGKDVYFWNRRLLKRDWFAQFKVAVNNSENDGTAGFIVCFRFVSALLHRKEIIKGFNERNLVVAQLKKIAEDRDAKESIRRNLTKTSSSGAHTKTAKEYFNELNELINEIDLSQPRAAFDQEGMDLVQVKPPVQQQVLDPKTQAELTAISKKPFDVFERYNALSDEGRKGVRWLLLLDPEAAKQKLFLPKLAWEELTYVGLVEPDEKGNYVWVKQMSLPECYQFAQQKHRLSPKRRRVDWFNYVNYLLDKDRMDRMLHAGRKALYQLNLVMLASHEAAKECFIENRKDRSRNEEFNSGRRSFESLLEFIDKLSFHGGGLVQTSDLLRKKVDQERVNARFATALDDLKQFDHFAQMNNKTVDFEEEQIKLIASCFDVLCETLQETALAKEIWSAQVTESNYLQQKKTVNENHQSLNTGVNDWMKQETREKLGIQIRRTESDVEVTSANLLSEEELIGSLTADPQVGNASSVNVAQHSQTPQAAHTHADQNDQDKYQKAINALAQRRDKLHAEYFHSILSSSKHKANLYKLHLLFKMARSYYALGAYGVCKPILKHIERTLNEPLTYLNVGKENLKEAFIAYVVCSQLWADCVSLDESQGYKVALSRLKKAMRIIKYERLKSSTVNLDNKMASLSLRAAALSGSLNNGSERHYITRAENALRIRLDDAILKEMIAAGDESTRKLHFITTILLSKGFYYHKVEQENRADKKERKCFTKLLQIDELLSQRGMSLNRFFEKSYKRGIIGNHSHALERFVWFKNKLNSAIQDEAQSGQAFSAQKADIKIWIESLIDSVTQNMEGYRSRALTGFRFAPSELYEKRQISVGHDVEADNYFGRGSTPIQQSSDESRAETLSKLKLPFLQVESNQDKRGEKLLRAIEAHEAGRENEAMNLFKYAVFYHRYDCEDPDYYTNVLKPLYFEKKLGDQKTAARRIMWCMEQSESQRDLSACLNNAHDDVTFWKGMLGSFENFIHYLNNWSEPKKNKERAAINTYVTGDDGSSKGSAHRGPQVSSSSSDKAHVTQSPSVYNFDVEKADSAPIQKAMACESKTFSALHVNEDKIADEYESLSLVEQDLVQLLLLMDLESSIPIDFILKEYYKEISSLKKKGVLYHRQQAIVSNNLRKSNFKASEILPITYRHNDLSLKISGDSWHKLATCSLDYWRMNETDELHISLYLPHLKQLLLFGPLPMSDSMFQPGSGDVMNSSFISLYVQLFGLLFKLDHRSGTPNAELLKPYSAYIEYLKQYLSGEPTLETVKYNIAVKPNPVVYRKSIISINKIISSMHNLNPRNHRLREMGWVDDVLLRARLEVRLAKLYRAEGNYVELNKAVANLEEFLLTGKSYVIGGSKAYHPLSRLYLDYVVLKAQSLQEQSDGVYTSKLAIKKLKAANEIVYKYPSAYPVGYKVTINMELVFATLSVFENQEVKREEIESFIQTAKKHLAIASDEIMSISVMNQRLYYTLAYFLVKGYLHSLILKHDKTNMQEREDEEESFRLANIHFDKLIPNSVKDKIEKTKNVELFSVMLNDTKQRLCVGIKHGYLGSMGRHAYKICQWYSAKYQSSGASGKNTVVVKYINDVEKWLKNYSTLDADGNIQSHQYSTPIEALRLNETTPAAGEEGEVSVNCVIF